MLSLFWRPGLASAPLLPSADPFCEHAVQFDGVWSVLHFRGFRRRVREACKAAGISFVKGLKNVASWILRCPAKAATLIRDLATAVLGGSRR